MAISTTINLFGTLAAREHAKLLLENQPQVRRIDASAGFRSLRLFLSAPIREDELLTLLMPSGISGFAIR